MTRQSKRLDWAGALARLERVKESCDRPESSPAELAQLYNDRATRLARIDNTENDVSKEDMMIVFRLGDERYALFLSDVVAVHKCAKLAAVPGAPDSVAGVIQFRGEIRPVYRLHNHQAKPMAKKENSCHVILMRAAGGQFGVLVDSVEEIRTVPNEERRLQSQSPHVAWITEDLVSVLKIETLQNKEPG